MAKLTLALLAAELSTLRNEVIVLRAELAALKAAPATAAPATDISDFIPMDEIDMSAYDNAVTTPTPATPAMSTPVAPTPSSAKATEFAALNCGIGAIKYIKKAPTASTTTYVDRKGQRWERVRVGNTATCRKIEG